MAFQSFYSELASNSTISFYFGYDWRQALGMRKLHTDRELYPLNGQRFDMSPIVNLMPKVCEGLFGIVEGVLSTGIKSKFVIYAGFSDD